MKKLFTLCVFTMALFLGTQSVSAQEESRSPEEIAKEKTYRIAQEFSLNDEQQAFVWRAFLGKEKAKQELNQGSFSEEQIKNITSKVDENFYKLMEESLTEQQYFKFKKNIKEYL